MEPAAAAAATAAAELVQGTSRDSLVSELRLRGGLLSGETEAELGWASIGVRPSSQPSSVCLPPTQFRPQTLFLRVLRHGGACEDKFTYGQVLFYLGEYIKTKGLFDKEQEHVVCCSNDLLGDVFGASSFSMREHRKLSAMIYRNLIAVDPSESTSPSESHESESELKKSVQELWEKQPSSVDTRSSTTSGRRSPSETEDNVEELPCGQPRSQQKSESSLSLPLSGCGMLSGIWPGEPGESSRRRPGFITSTLESEQEEHPCPSVGSGFPSARRPSSETEYSLNESPYGELKKRKKSDSSISFSFSGCGIFNSVGPGESSSCHTMVFPSNKVIPKEESAQDPWAKHLFPNAGTRPFTSSEGRPSETEGSVEEIPRGQSVEKTESSLSQPGGEYSAHSDRISEQSSGSPAVALFSSQESEQEPWEEHPSPSVGTELSSSSRRPSSETDEDVDKLPYEQSGNLEKSESESSISHSVGECSVRSDVASVQSSGHPSVITTPSSPDNSADAISDQFSVEYEVESMESEDYSPNEEGEELGPALALQGSQKLAVQEKGTPPLLPQPSTAHDPTGGKPVQGSYSQPPQVRESNPRAVSAMSNYWSGLGDSHSSSWRAPSSSLSITEPCIICLSHPKNGCIVHGITGHLVTCYTCARRLQRRDKPCPVCRQPIHLTVLVYLS
ncbi:LOW QUALITY PROTEIN: E3 ubiquitin-protein ligase Mdm2-like [Gracilinanus agilis]|uniref:LOW QUALITY PROTEIN: E3 ubiquitin-protein ligase Mdm2-like n=1 Tax=Gracilinanus agilis TaxID=191870 RepID=UPI001CFF218C|nr:LOW QUALITY PROTEIN: E3 ubiquitin-protein ligase Mdm2-like [Gracilinanus agilis]